MVGSFELDVRQGFPGNFAQRHSMPSRTEKFQRKARDPTEKNDGINQEPDEVLRFSPEEEAVRPPRTAAYIIPSNCTL